MNDRAIRAALFLVAALSPCMVLGQRPDSTVRARNDSVLIRLIDVEVRSAIQAFAPFLDRPVVYGTLGPGKVTVDTPSPVRISELPALLRSLLQSHDLELITDSANYRIRVKEPVRAAATGQTARQAEPLELFTVRLSHARAVDVAATVNALYGRASAPGEIGASAPQTLGDQLRQQLVPGVGSPNAPVVPQSPGRPATLTGEVTIVPDLKANSLLIRSSRTDFDLLSAAIQQIDVRPQQVLVEVLIVEMRRDKRFDWGVETAMPPQRVGNGNTTIEGSTAGGGIGDLVLTIMNLGGIELDARLRAAEARGDVEIISRPVVVTANNKRAEIVVGSQRPFVQVSRTLPTDSPLRDEIVQYRDVATRLYVLPTIGEDGYVMLDVTQEVNAATNETEFNAPVISTRALQTSLLIRDGQTIALGGLTDSQKDVSQGGVPFLSQIPVLGGLFGRYSRRSTETELFLFITPRVISSDADALNATEPYLNRARKKKP